MKRFLLFFSLVVLICSCTSGVLLVHAADKIAAETLRLHVLANSDSDYDQACKLAARDAVLVAMETLTADCSDKIDVMETVYANTEVLRAAALSALQARGCNLPVTVTVCREQYPTRVYETVTLPAGIYDSVQVKIGAADGQNWWCVLFPPLCMGAAEVHEELIEVGLTPGQVELITDRNAVDYEVRFKIVEWARALQG